MGRLNCMHVIFGIRKSMVQLLSWYTLSSSRAHLEVRLCVAYQLLCWLLRWRQQVSTTSKITIDNNNCVYVCQFAEHILSGLNGIQSMIASLDSRYDVRDYVKLIHWPFDSRPWVTSTVPLPVSSQKWWNVLKPVQLTTDYQRSKIYLQQRIKSVDSIHSNAHQLQFYTSFREVGHF